MLEQGAAFPISSCNTGCTTIGIPELCTLAKLGIHCQMEKNPYWVTRKPAGCQALGTYCGSGTLLVVGHTGKQG